MGICLLCTCKAATVRNYLNRQYIYPAKYPPAQERRTSAKQWPCPACHSNRGKYDCKLTKQATI
eukprot:12894443-Prorocentrum_lima.AAC.1